MSRKPSCEEDAALALTMSLIMAQVDEDTGVPAVNSFFSQSMIEHSKYRERMTSGIPLKEGEVVSVCSNCEFTSRIPENEYIEAGGPDAYLCPMCEHEKKVKG